MDNIIFELYRLFLLPGGQRYGQQLPNGDYPPPPNREPGEDWGRLTDAVLRQHLAGAVTITLVLPSEDSLCRTAVVDLDGGAAHWPLVQKLYRAAQEELGLPAPAVSASGGKGFGVWFSFAEPVPVADAQAFLRLFRKAYFPEIPPSEHDLRPDSTGAVSGKTNVKLAPAFHRRKGVERWSYWVDMAQVEETPAIGLDAAPDLEGQARILSTVQSMTLATFMRARDGLARRAGNSNGQDGGPRHRPLLDQLPEGNHPSCIRVLLEQGAPHALDYNTANLNLAAYAASRGLSPEEGLELARRMAEVSEESGHPTSKKGVEAKVRNFRSNREPAPFHCDFPHNTPAWRQAFDPDRRNAACRSCAACPATLLSGAMAGQEEGEPKEKVFVLEESVALELLAWAWAEKHPLRQIRRAWPLVILQLGEGRRHALPLALLAGLASDHGNPTTAGFFEELDRYLSEIRASDELKEQLRIAAKPAGEAFLARLRGTPVAEASGKAALVRALHLERRLLLAEELDAASRHGPEVAAATVAFAVRQAADITLQEEGTGPLANFRGELLTALARSDRNTVETPFPKLTRLLHGGWRGSRLYVLLAPPKAGKTTLAAQCLDHAAALGHPALYVGYEMAREQMVEYALARRLGLNARRIETRELSAVEARQVVEGLEAYLAREGRWLELWEAGLAVSVGDIAAWCTAAKAKAPGKTPLVVVDYLQLAQTGLREIDAHPSETKRVSAVAVACKDLARQTGAAVLALSSVTKEGEVAAKMAGELDVTAARDSLTIIHAADGVLTLQTQPIYVAEGKGDRKTETLVDPWAFVAFQASQRGEERLAADLSRVLDRVAQDYPQSGPGKACRARLTLSRHRGATGDVLLYYRKAWHRMEVVDLPGLEVSDREDGYSPAEAIAVFREYAEAAAAGPRPAPSPAEGSAPEEPDPSPATSGREEPFRSCVEVREDGGSTEVAYRLVTEAEDAQRAVAALAEQGRLVGLDLETTGLDPLTAQARLLQLAPAEGPVTIIDLAQAGGLHPLRGPLAALAAVAHNATFDMAFLRRAGVLLVPDCTLLANHVLTGKAEKLAILAERHLGLMLDKGAQASDWSGPLTEGQLRYAALDALAVQSLFPVLQKELDLRRSMRAYELTRNAQAAVVSMELAGMPFDMAAQRHLVGRLTAERDRLRAALEEALAGRNPNSGPQLAAWLTEALGGPESSKHKAWPKTSSGQLATGADELRKGAAYLPPAFEQVVLDLLLPYKVVEKQCSTYGASLEKHLHPVTDRIHARFNLAGTVTGRMSSSHPNMQNIPRDKEFRGLFRAPEGRVFAIADYSQMELRVAALLAGEEALLEAYREGRDTHVLTAAMLLGKVPEEVTKAERQLAKAVNFGLLYGQGARGLQAYAASSYGVELTEETARRHRTAWFKAYPAFVAWHARGGAAAKRALAVRTPAGRDRRWETAARNAPGGFRETEAYNTPVQGGAAEVMLAALHHLDRRLAASGLDAVPVAVVHDELIVEASAGDAPEVARLLEASMVAGMLDIFPEAATTGLVEARVGPSWADK